MFLEELSSGMFLYGGPGVGKTYAAVAALKEFMAAIAPAVASWRFATVPEILLEIRETFSEGADRTEGEVVRAYADVELLILDDLGAEKTTEWALQALYLVIDRRYRNGKRTIVTSNLTLDEVSDKLGDRIASRIAGMCRVVRMDGKDRRIGK